ncbi:MAG: hypothetical protein ACE5JU_20515 [Candidatus Binatia bacterium]
MASQCSRVEGFQLDLRDGDVWRWLAGGRRHVSVLAEEVTERRLQGQALSRPRAIYRQLGVEDVTSRGVLMEEDVWLEATGLGEFFRGAEEAVFIVVTIGADLERQVATLFGEGRRVEAFVLDAVGTAAATSAFRSIAGHICREAGEKGRQTGPALRPGQDYWDITGQRSIFQVLPTQNLGVRLLDSCFMSPQKTQSAVIPLGTHLKVQGDPGEPYCGYCTAKRCPTRMGY